MASGCRIAFDPSKTARRQMLLFGGSGGNLVIRGARLVPREFDDGGVGTKRPFFTAPDDILEEEYYDDQPEKKRRLTPEQVMLLEKSFVEENKLEPERKTELAKKLGVAPRQVAVWFQNRRARWKTKQLENEFDRLKSNYDSLLADHHSLLEDNDSLRSQVKALTEKLQAKEPFSDDIAGANQVPAVLTTELTMNLKAGDRPSPGTNGSAVADTSADHQLGEYFTGESYFKEQYRACIGRSEECPSLNEDCNFFPDSTSLTGVDDATLASWGWVWS